LIGALAAEVVIGNRVAKQTDIIEAALTNSLKGALLANADLAKKIRREQTDIAGVKADVSGAKSDMHTAQQAIADLGTKEGVLSAAIAADENRLKLVANATLPVPMTKRGWDAIQKLRGKLKAVAIAHAPDFGANVFAVQLQSAFWHAGIPVREIQVPGDDVWMGYNVVTSAPDMARAKNDPLAKALNTLAPFDASPAGTGFMAVPNAPFDIPFIAIGVRQTQFEKTPYQGPHPERSIPIPQEKSPPPPDTGERRVKTLVISPRK
jgi:hypothetical protein